MSDKKYYEIAERELKDNIIDKALWSKASTLSKGDEEKTKYQYIQLRVDEIKEKTNHEQKQVIKGKVKETSVIFSKVIGGILGIALLIFVSIGAVESYKNYMDTMIPYTLLCKNNESLLDNRTVEAEISRRAFSKGLSQIDKLDFKEKEGYVGGFSRYKLEPPKGAENLGYFSEVVGSHRFRKAKLGKRQTIMLDPSKGATISNLRQIFIPDDNDKITDLVFAEKDNYIELTSSEYVRKEPEDKIVSRYECKLTK